jgi:hypothetical protein
MEATAGNPDRSRKEEGGPYQVRPSFCGKLVAAIRYG